MPIASDVASVRIEVDRNEVYRYLGYDRGYAPPARIACRVEEHLASARGLFRPAYSYAMRDIRQVKKGKIRLDGSLAFHSPIMARMFKGCQQTAIFLVTIGQRLENRVTQLKEQGRVLDAAILDAIGSELVEKTACWLEGEIRNKAMAQGLGLTLRYSPGYCDWDISGQRALFQAIDAESAGVCLTEELLMVPRKSVSGIIGIGRWDTIGVRRSPCRRCPRQDCQTRR